MRDDTSAFLDALSRLEPIQIGNVRGMRQRRELLAELFDEGAPDVDASLGFIAGTRVKTFDPKGVAHAGTVVYVHGGGWMAGDVNTHDGICRTICYNSGLRVISVDYRRAPERHHPAQVIEVVEALRTIQADPSRSCGPLSLAGDSSGAHIASQAALSWEPPTGENPLAGLLLIQPASDPSMRNPTWTSLGEGLFLTAKAMRWYWDAYLQGQKLVPLHELDLTRLPPTYVFTSSLDPTYGEALQLTERLVECGVSTVHDHADGLPHACLTLAGAFPTATSHIVAAANWLRLRSDESTLTK